MRLLLQPYDTKSPRIDAGFYIPLYYTWKLAYHLRYPESNCFAVEYCVNTWYLKGGSRDWKEIRNGLNVSSLDPCHLFTSIEIDKLKQVVKRLYDKRTN